ncbi:MAG: hypothetical protein KJ957_03690 [Candidatus Omnitrophica bacterium]|nr:hypothetical protein [Candidatus Omnitrophota bacterium]
MLRILSKIEAEDFIIDLLKRCGKLFTRQVELEALDKDLQCPDSTSRTLNSLRIEGKIKGEFSLKDKGWLWWNA